MFRVMFLSRRESQRLTSVDTRAQFSFRISKQDICRISLFLQIYKRWGHNSCKITSKRCSKNFSFPSQFFQFTKLTLSFKIFYLKKKKELLYIFKLSIIICNKFSHLLLFLKDFLKKSHFAFFQDFLKNNDAKCF